MISDDKVNEIVSELEKEILKLEKDVLNEMPRPTGPEVTEKISKILEGIVEKYEN